VNATCPPFDLQPVSLEKFIELALVLARFAPFIHRTCRYCAKVMAQRSSSKKFSKISRGVCGGQKF
jgi:hypothetical protein